MRTLIRDYEDRLASFLDQRSRLLLVVEAGDAEHVALLKLVETLEQTREQNVFWTFPQRFDDTESYVASIFEYVTQRLQPLALYWETEERTPMPSMPAACTDPARSSVERCRELLVYLRSLVSALDERAVVITFAPFEVDAPDAFASFVLELLKHDVRLPWCHHMRFLVREHPARPFLVPQLRGLRRAETYRPDLGHEAVERSLEHDVNDASLPLSARLQALLVAAGMDTAHMRIADAMAKYRLLYRYYSAVQDKAMVAVSLNGVGETFSRAGDFAQAKKYLESALPIAIESQALGVVFAATFNLAYLHFTHERYARAYDYYEALAALAMAASNASMKLHALEQMGVCKQHLEQYDPALKHFKEAAQLAEGLGATEEHVSALKRVRTMFDNARMNEHVVEMDKLIDRVASQSATHQVTP